MLRSTLRLSALSKCNSTLPELSAAVKSAAVTPYMSEKQIHFHWDKHHRAYFNNLAGLYEKQPELKKLNLVELVNEAKKTGNKPLFNNAAQALNHNFFWECIDMEGKFDPKKHVLLAEKLESDLGGYEKAVALLSEEAKKHFGSGWAWLVVNKDGVLEVKSYHDADTPFAHGETPLLTIDVWEHAYYIDYQNRRPDFIANYFGKLANWNFAEENLKAMEK